MTVIDRIHFRHRYLIPTVRLRGYDYSSSGYYAVTFCTKDRQCFLSEISNTKYRLLPPGDIVLSCWNDLPKHFPSCGLETIIIMPNHVHLIIRLQSLGGTYKSETGQRPVSTNRRITLGNIVGALKSYSAREIRIYRQSKDDVWQPRFYEHIIRNEQSFENIKQYFENNPLHWDQDKENISVETGL